VLTYKCKKKGGSKSGFNVINYPINIYWWSFLFRGEEKDLTYFQITIFANTINVYIYLLLLLRILLTQGNKAK